MTGTVHFCHLRRSPERMKRRGNALFNPGPIDRFPSVSSLVLRPFAGAPFILISLTHKPSTSGRFSLDHHLLP